MNKEIVWTSYGLGSAGCALLLKWLRGSNIEMRQSSPRQFRDDFIKWRSSWGTETYTKIFIVDLDLSKSINVVDSENCIIIDTHQTHIDNKHLYTNAKIAINNYPSTVKFLLKLFKADATSKLTTAQLKLLCAIDDYASNTNKHTASKQLNALYWSYTGNKLHRFINDFDSGLTTFSTIQKNAIALYFKQLNHNLSQLDVFYCVLPHKHNTYKVFSTFADAWFDEVSDHLLNFYKADIAVVVNLKNKSVFMRKQQECTLSVAKLAERLCDGGGNMDFAGGSITDKFLEFCKTLQHV